MARRSVPRWDPAIPGARRLDRLGGERARIRLESGSPDRTLALGRAIGSILPPGTALSLEGGLGAGKTLFAKGLCGGLGVSDEVTSPSFILAEEYRGVFPVFHFDLYRLERVDDAAGIGFFDAIDGRAVVIVEWGDRLPPGAVEFDVVARFRVTGPESREIEIAGPKELCDELERNS